MRGFGVTVVVNAFKLAQYDLHGTYEMPVMTQTAACGGQTFELIDLIFKELDIVIVRLFVVSEAGVCCVTEEDEVVVDHRR